ncbi:MAG: glycosyltransferase [Candidatus Bathyarchaeia archaeon]|jgi:cellulose synthase/poly-beta-1,6-N-acetylglucosamine synthase-like glycosyltransferase
MPLLLVFFWLLFGLLAFAPPAFIYLYMKHKSKAAWPTKIDGNYAPKVSIIIPTYNEAEIIKYKLSNTSHLTYPQNLTEIIVVDSNSSDGTAQIVSDYVKQNPHLNVKLVLEQQRKGKSHALNTALTQCSGDIIAISDADCFWPKDILTKAIPYLADPNVGAIGGPKILFNKDQTWITRMEQGYLKSANMLRLGESKAGSTLFFEGGFSAFRREALERFDPYETGSDDCGTVLSVIEHDFRAMLVVDAKFYSSFPATFRGKISIKLRRTIQLVHVFSQYLRLLVAGKAEKTRKTVVPNTMLYLFSPIAFIVFAFFTTFLLLSYPLLFALFVLLLIPQIRFYTYQIVENNFLLFISILAVLFGKKFSIWSKPDDRIWLNEANLAFYGLI